MSSVGGVFSPPVVAAHPLSQTRSPPASSHSTILAAERGASSIPSLSSSQATIRPASVISNAPGSGEGSGAGSRNSIGPGIPGSGLKTPSNRKTIYDRNLNRYKGAELSKASFAYVFSEMVVYAQKKVTGVQDFERRLADRGYPVGLRLISLLTQRSLPTSSSSSSSSSAGQRQTRILPLLQFLTTHLWRTLFNRQADSLRQADNKANEYYLTDNEPLTGEFISVPKEMSLFNPGAYIAGIIEGCCDGYGMPAKVSAVNGDSKMWPQQTVWVIAFEELVVKREEALAKAEKEGKR